MDNKELKQRIARGVRAVRAQEQAHAAAVVVALVPSVGEPLGIDVLLEVRASSLEQQPGEVCCPGGHVEPGETPVEAAIRETCEELLVSPAQVSLVGSLGVVPGPGNLPLHVFAARLSDYRATFSTDEVASVFTIPVSWLLEHEPRTYRVRYDPVPPADFPWDKVEGGRAYRWRPKCEDVPFYEGIPTRKVAVGSSAPRSSSVLGGSSGSPLVSGGLSASDFLAGRLSADGFPPGEEPVVWGATARVLRLFAHVMRGTGQKEPEQ